MRYLLDLDDQPARAAIKQKGITWCNCDSTVRWYCPLLIPTESPRSTHTIISNFLFWHRSLAGTARWESRLRAGGTAGFCFVATATPSGFAVPPRNKTNCEVSWLPHKKAALGTGEQAPLALSAPREKGQKRRKHRDRGNQNQADIRGNAKRGRIRPAGRHWRRTPWQSTRTYNGLPDPLTPSKSASRTRTPDPRSLHDC